MLSRFPQTLVLFNCNSFFVIYYYSFVISSFGNVRFSKNLNYLSNERSPTCRKFFRTMFDIFFHIFYICISTIFARNRISHFNMERLLQLLQTGVKNVPLILNCYTVYPTAIKIEKNRFDFSLLKIAISIFLSIHSCIDKLLFEYI